MILIGNNRRGLARFVNHIVYVDVPGRWGYSFTVNYRNHPIIKDDGLLHVFLTEPSFETWKKQHTVSLDEESASKRLDRTEEMSIPGDLEEKLKYVPALLMFLELSS